MLQANRLGIDEFNQVELMSTMAMFDTMIIVWKEKRRWDAVRPFTAIKYLYGDNVRYNNTLLLSGWYIEKHVSMYLCNYVFYSF